MFAGDATKVTRQSWRLGRSCLSHAARLFAGPLFNGLDLTNLVVAGAVGHALKLGDTTDAIVRERAKDPTWSADVDLFIVADDEAIARATFDRAYEHLITLNRPGHARIAPEDGRPAHGGKAVSFYGLSAAHDPAHPSAPPCVADVIFGFDVDACQLAYDGKTVLATPSAVRALHRTGINIADPERSSPAYEKRLSKYVTRGFAVAVPGLEIDRVAKAVQERSLHYVDHHLFPRTHLWWRRHAQLSDRRAGDRRLPNLLVLSALKACDEGPAPRSPDPIRQRRRR